MKPDPTNRTAPSEQDLPEEPTLPRKLGANHSETAARPRKHHQNFKQSRDIREDRGIRQIKSQLPGQTKRGK